MLPQNICVTLYCVTLNSELRWSGPSAGSRMTTLVFRLTKGAFFWDYSGIGILGIDGICVLLGAIPFSEGTEYHSVHSAPDSRMNRMKGIRFTRNRQNTRSFGKFLAGNPTRP